MPYFAVVVALLLAAFVRVFCGQLQPSMPLSLAAFSGGVLRVFRTVVLRVNGRRCPALLGLFFVWSDARLPYFLSIKALCRCKK